MGHRNVAAHLAEQLHHLLCKDPVAYRSAVGFGRAMRFAANPTGEPKWIEPVSLPVGGYGLGNGLPSSSDAMRPSCVPGMVRSASETCHLPR